MKIIIAATFVLIFASLAGAGFFIMKDQGRTRNTAWALTVRIGLSVSLFVFIWFAHWMGWIQSTGLPIGR
ncbi:MAG: twin transmembrane helix small protein [Lautropia sp.]